MPPYRTITSNEEPNKTLQGITNHRCSVVLRTEGDIVEGWGEVDERDVDRVLGADCEKDGEGARFWGGVTIFWRVCDVCSWTSKETAFEFTYRFPNFRSFSAALSLFAGISRQ